MPLFGPSFFESTRDKKLADRQDALDKASKALDKIPVHPNEETIVSTPAYQLADKIKAKEYSTLTVVAAFARRCIETHNETNCLTEVMIVEALEKAKSHDEFQKSNSTTLGPLHGIPFTLKDTFDVESYDTCLGITTRADQPAQTSSILYSTLTRHGGILLAKTNVPQTLLSFECNNPVFGVTQNPFVKGYTCGGSSGGEAVVLAKNASALGFGSDIGGSLRIPTGWCGVYALKPTRGRFPTKGHASMAPGFEGIPTVCGPMGRNVEDLIFMLKIILAENLSVVDTTMIPSIWNDSVFTTYSSKKLKFGYYFDDGVTIASPPVKRAIEQTVQALQSQGHEVILTTPPNVLEVVRIFLALTSAENYNNLRTPIKPDPMEQSVRFILTLSRFPSWLRSFLASIIEYILGDPISSSTIRVVGGKSAAEINQWTKRRDDFRQSFNEYFQNSQFDALIAPTSTIPAPKINGTTMVSALATSTLLYNVLDWPVGVVPVTKVKAGEVMEEGRWKEREGHSWMFLDQVYGRGKVYTDIVEGGEGLPVGVQVVAGASIGEEGVLAIMGQVVAALKEDGAEL